jgi:hypothetical protein
MNRNPFAPGTSSGGNAARNIQPRGGFERIGDDSGGGGNRSRSIHQSPHNNSPQQQTTQKNRNPFSDGKSPQYQEPVSHHKHQQYPTGSNHGGQQFHQPGSFVDTGKRNVFTTSSEGNGGGGRGNAGGRHNVATDFQQQQYQRGVSSTQQQQQHRLSPNIPQNQQHMNRNPFAASGVGAPESSNTTGIGNAMSNVHAKRFSTGGGVDRSPHYATSNDAHHRHGNSTDTIHTGGPASNSMNKNPFARTDIISNIQAKVFHQHEHQHQRCEEPRQFQPQYPKMSVQNNAVLQRIDASVAIAGQLKADIELNFDFIDESSSVPETNVSPTTGGRLAPTTVAEAVVSGSCASSTVSSLQGVIGLPTTASSPFDALPERPPDNNPYGSAAASAGTVFRAGLIPTVAPPDAVV